VSPKVRVYAAWVILAATLILWPVSMISFAKDEPPVVLSLSWLAITITAADLLSTSDVRREQEGDQTANPDRG
jgi:hypothetical protein